MEYKVGQRVKLISNDLQETFGVGLKGIIHNIIPDDPIPIQVKWESQEIFWVRPEEIESIEPFWKKLLN